MQRIVRDKSSGGVFFPESALDDLNTGGPKEFRVLSVGDQVEHIKPGDRVICHSYTTGPIPVADGDLITLDQVLAVLPA